MFLILLSLVAGMVSCSPNPVQHNLAITSTEGGLVTVPGEGIFIYDEGAIVNLTAEAEEGYCFVEWTGNVSTIADVNVASTNITINGDYSIVASFTATLPTRYSLNISSTTGGLVTTPGQGIFTYNGGTVVNLAAIPDTYYDFVNWTGDVSTITSISAAFTTITMNGNYSISANFAQEQAVTFPDPNLEAEIREAIDKSTGDVYPSELEALTLLNANGKDIADLTGLECCTSLTSVSLGSNQITNVSPLANLTSLTWLGLDNNQITDISPLANLTSLTTLELQINQISDVSPLVNLTGLTWLTLNGNQISDISPLANLTNLTMLQLNVNQISDISPLANLTSLTQLSLRLNQISDISPLANLTSLTQLWLSHNQISDVSPLADLTSLTYIELINNQIGNISSLANLTGLTHLLLYDNQISDISSLANLTNLTSLLLWNNQISDISSLANLTNLASLYLNYNQISDVSPLLENVGLGTGDYVYLTENPLSDDSINTYIPELEARGVTVAY
jgi:Leucine-rich repeat (LRR) protein